MSHSADSRDRGSSDLWLHCLTSFLLVLLAGVNLFVGILALEMSQVKAHDRLEVPTGVIKSSYIMQGVLETHSLMVIVHDPGPDRLFWR